MHSFPKDIMTSDDLNFDYEQDEFEEARQNAMLNHISLQDKTGIFRGIEIVAKIIKE